MKNKALFEPIIIVFLSLFVFTAGTYFAIMTPLVLLTAPAFFMVIERRHGLRLALLCACFGSALLFAAADAMSSIIYLMAVGFLGAFFGHTAGRVKSGAEYLLVSITASVSVKMLLLILFYTFTGINPFFISPETAIGMANTLAEVLSSSGISLSDDAIRVYAQNLTNTVSNQIPSMLIFLSVFDTFGSYLVSWKIVKRFGGGKIVSLPPFGLWRFPRNIFFAFFAAVIADAVGRMSPSNHVFTMIAANILELLRGIFFLEGLALCWYYMTARGVSRLFKMAVTTICVVSWPVSFILSSLGFLDVWFDLRRHIRRKQK